jgi:hypothetical protein
MGKFFFQPIYDYVAALRLLNPVWSGLLVGSIGLFIGWWIYVPVHELLHAWGCIVSGGEVTELQMSSEYGAVFLQGWFPFIVVGSDYAGQLTGFDTKGSDWIYAFTVFAPFLITIIPGVPLYQRVVHRSNPGLIACFFFGMLLPVAYAPFVSAFGDFYELGSIAASNLYGTWGIDGSHWRSDDLFLLISDLGSDTAPVRAVDISGITIGFVLGVMAALATYGLGTLLGKPLLRKSRPAYQRHNY